MLSRHNTSNIRGINRANRIHAGCGRTLHRLTDCQYHNQPLWLDIDNLYKIEKAKKIADILKSKNCPQDLLIDFGNSDENEIIVLILEALRTEYSPCNLQLYLQNITDSIEVENGLVTLLKSGRQKQDLQIDLSDTDISDNGVKEIVKTLLGNTAVTELNLDPHSATEEQLNIIKYCCFRNQLINKMPTYESVIKQISFQHGMYSPCSTFMTAQSLKCVVGSFLSLNKQVPIPDRKLPIELKEYIASLDAIAVELLPYMPGCRRY